MTTREYVSKGWVNWPTPCAEGRECKLIHDSWHHSGENGMEAWLFTRFNMEDRVCSADGYIEFRYHPVNLYSLLEDLLPPDDPSRSGTYDANAAVLIGSTSLALWNPLHCEYFTVSKDDLTGEGKAMFDLIAKLFGREPEIVTSLDT